MAEFGTVPRWNGTFAKYLIDNELYTQEDVVARQEDFLCREMVDYLLTDRNRDIVTLKNIQNGITEDVNSNECWIEIRDENNDDCEFDNLILGAFKELKKGEIKGIIKEDLGNANETKEIRGVNVKIGTNNGKKFFYCPRNISNYDMDRFYAHIFQEEGFNKRCGDCRNPSYATNTYIKPIYVKDFSELQRKSPNCYLYGYKIILDKDENFSFANIVQRAGKVKYFELCFVDDASNFYRIKTKVDKRKYFLPTMVGWNDTEKLIYVEIDFNESKEPGYNVDPNFYSSAKAIYFDCTSSTKENYKISNISTKILAVLSDKKPEIVYDGSNWAKAFAGCKTVSLLENNDIFEYTLNIKLKEGGSKVINAIDLGSIRGYLAGGQLKRIGEEDEELREVELKNAGDEVGELYKIEIASNQPDVFKLELRGEKIFYKGQSVGLCKKQQDNGTWNDFILSNNGKLKLQSHCKYNTCFFTDKNGIAKYGYSHAQNMSFTNDDTLWNNFKSGIEGQGYAIDDNGKVTKGGAVIKEETFDYKVFNDDISKALKADLEENICARIMDDVNGIGKLIQSDIPRNGRGPSAYLYNCWYNQQRSDITKKLKQEQWDALVISCYEKRENFDNFLKKIINANPNNYESFCEAVYNNAGAVETEKPELAESWRQEIKDLFKTDRIRRQEEVEDRYRRSQEISSIEITARTNVECEVLSVMKEGCNERTKIAQYANETNAYIYCLRPKTEKQDLEEQTTTLNENEVNWMNEKEFINRWSAENAGRNEEIDKQWLINTNRYFDFYSGMTPYVEVWLRGKLIKQDAEGVDRFSWNIINSIDHPYIKNLSVEDKGVKQVSLTLFDKDFASYQTGVLGAFGSATKEGVEPYSLEDLIRQSLAMEESSSGNEEKPEPYKPIQGQEELKSNYLKFNNAQSRMTPANLRIRFGYCDANPDVAKSKDEKIKKYFNSKGISTDESKGRTNRWWNVQQNLLEANKTIKIKVKINSNSRTVDDGETILQNAPAAQKAEANDANVSDNEKEISYDETTVLSYIKDYMITGYTSSLKQNGIEYTLNGIEVCHAEIMKKRFLQRYMDIASNPVEVLYILMRMFNEAKDNEENPTGVKLVYYNDKKDIPAVDTINMSLDFSALSERDKAKFADVDDYYTARMVNKISINPKLLKSISISLGGEEAIKNYSSALERPLYKNVETLINEFCAACPSRREKISDDTKAYDDNGNEIKNDTYTSNEVLSWFIATPTAGSKDTNIYIVLYYRKAKPVKKIRLYQWGPELGGQTVVKNLAIQNKNEFAILSGISSIQAKNGKLMRNVKYNLKNIKLKRQVGAVEQANPPLGSVVEENPDFEGGDILNAGYINETDFDTNKYNNAFDNCMYVGRMDILGDPSLEFNLLRQPYTYPIRLEVIVPRNDLYFKNKDVRNKENEGQFGHRPSYGNSNQRLHEMTGYYVITKINHNISASGYTTSLELTSYPRIENDILIKKDGNLVPPEIKE